VTCCCARGSRCAGMWGLLDGIYDAGLAVSLTFGGRPEVGEGFSIPLVIRYVLEVCRTAHEAMRVLHRVPVHMSYNVTAVDRAGRRATAYLAPDRPTGITARAVATNHQGEVEWVPYAAAIRSVERQQRLEELLADGTGASGVAAACLLPPAVRHPLRSRLRDLVHRRLPAGERFAGAPRTSPLAFSWCP
jgi:Acyl-coenzyme A:6-aminopenicillanic acid acyl-transferase